MGEEQVSNYPNQSQKTIRHDSINNSKYQSKKYFFPFDPDLNHGKRQTERKLFDFNDERDEQASN